MYDSAPSSLTNYPFHPSVHQAVFGDDEEQDAKGLSSAEDSRAGGAPGGARGGSIGSAEEVDDVNLQPDAVAAPAAPAAALVGGSDVGEWAI